MVLLLLAALCCWLALHPFTTYPMTLALVRRVKARAIAPVASLESAPSPERFAICTCAYNEERVIAEKIANLLEVKARYPAVQVLLYVDAATDRTAEIARRYESQLTLHVAQERHGKTYGMNRLVALADADILVFTDANVILAPDVIERLGEHFADPQIGCVCGNLNYVNADASVTAQAGSLYWRIEERIKSLETATGSVIGADGSLFAMRRGLHRPPPDDIIDDFYLSLSVLCQGQRVVQAQDVRAYEESVPVAAEEFRRKIRIACQAFNVHRLMWADIKRLDALNVYKYVSHKLLRWLGIYAIVAAWLFAIAGFLSMGQLSFALLVFLSPIALWSLGSRWPVRPFSQIYDILGAFVGTGLGVMRSLRGDRFQTWAPAASLRK